jgi:predicted PurR-regulated permease PerM
MLPVNVIDNILKPLVMTRGITTPLIVILFGVIGGTISCGVTGLFLGPIVLAVRRQFRIELRQTQSGQSAWHDPDGLAPALFQAEQRAGGAGGGHRRNARGQP